MKLLKSFFPNNQDQPSESDIIEALKKAQVWEVISALPDGLETRPGGAGSQFSGGQKQRIAIARAIVRKPKILLLDEATSALDSEVEAAIQESLYRLMENKTVIAIAHRLSTIAAMDRLIVLDDGKIAEQGTHGELLAKGGIYAQLWAHQTGGFLGA